MKYSQELPPDVEKALDAYLDRIKAIRWFEPAADVKRESVDTAIKAALSAFGVEASIEYRKLITPQDWGAAWDAARGAAWDAAWDAARGAAWDAAWGAAWGAAWDAAWGAAWDAARDAAWDAARDAAWDAAWGAAWSAAWDAARGAADILASFTSSYKKATPFVKLVDLWEMGLYPIGVVEGKFVVYVPPCKLEFPQDLPESNHTK